MSYLSTMFAVCSVAAALAVLLTATGNMNPTTGAAVGAAVAGGYTVGMIDGLATKRARR